jgi:hypothetical protein
MEEYVVLGPNSPVPLVKEQWSVLPDYVKSRIMEEAEKMGTPQGMHIRRDLLLPVLGYREMSVANSKLAKGLRKEHKYAIKLAGLIWSSIVGIAKGNIILKTPIVLIDNVISNIMLSIILGSNPIQVLKLQLQGVTELNKFLSDSRALLKLETKLKAGTITKEESRELKMYRNRVETSTVKDLIDNEGMYTQILEEFDSREELDNGNVVSTYFHNKLKGYPSFIRNGTSMLFLDNRTGYFKFMNRSTQYSDFIARYAQYNLSKRKGMGHREAVDLARSAFVNYAAPNSPLIEWANQMGIVMFTKYFTRIQRFIGESVREHPVRVAVGLLTLGAVAPGVPTPWDASVLDKDIFSVVQNPINTLGNVLTPGLLHATSG